MNIYIREKRFLTSIFGVYLMCGLSVIAGYLHLKKKDKNNKDIEQLN